MWFRIANGCSTWNMLSVSGYPADSSIVACRSDTERQSFALSVSGHGARSSAQSPLFHVEPYVGWHAMAGGEFCAYAVFYVEHSFMPYLPSQLWRVDRTGLLLQLCCAWHNFEFNSPESFAAVQRSTWNIRSSLSGERVNYLGTHLLLRPPSPGNSGLQPSNAPCRPPVEPMFTPPVISVVRRSAKKAGDRPRMPRIVLLHSRAPNITVK